MRQKQIWMIVITDANEVIFNKACQSKQKAQTAAVEYLRNNKEFDGRSFDEACFWIGEKDLPLDLMVFPVQQEDFKNASLTLPLSISPPPKERGLFRVVYVLDVGAGNVTQAAMNAYEMMSASDSLPPVLEVIDNKGNKVRIDLSKRKKKGKKPC